MHRQFFALSSGVYITKIVACSNMSLFPEPVTLIINLVFHVMILKFSTPSSFCAMLYSSQGSTLDIILYACPAYSKYHVIIVIVKRQALSSLTMVIPL